MWSHRSYFILHHLLAKTSTQYNNHPRIMVIIIIRLLAWHFIVRISCKMEQQILSCWRKPNQCQGQTKMLVKNPHTHHWKCVLGFNSFLEFSFLFKSFRYKNKDVQFWTFFATAANFFFFLKKENNVSPIFFYNLIKIYSNILSKVDLFRTMKKICLQVKETIVAYAINGHLTW